MNQVFTLACSLQLSQSSLNTIGPLYFWYRLDNKFNLSSHLMSYQISCILDFELQQICPLVYPTELIIRVPTMWSFCKASALSSSVTVCHKFLHKIIPLIAADIHIYWSIFLPFLFWCKNINQGYSHPFLSLLFVHYS